MKGLAISISLLLFLSTAVAGGAYGEEAKPVTPPGGAAAPVKASSADDPAPGKGPAVRVKVKARGSFTGTVVQIDPVEKTLTLRNKGVLVTFDAANPVLKGYRSLQDIKRGHTVSVSYSQDGLFIGKGTLGPPEGVQARETRAPKPQKSLTQGKEAGKSKKSSLVRVQERSRGTSFDDVDENKDGRITAVELSVVTPGLTVQEFKQYDRNNDGCLDRKEYNAIRKP